MASVTTDPIAAIIPPIIINAKINDTIINTIMPGDIPSASLPILGFALNENPRIIKPIQKTIWVIPIPMMAVILPAIIFTGVTEVSIISIVRFSFSSVIACIKYPDVVNTANININKTKTGDRNLNLS